MTKLEELIKEHCPNGVEKVYVSDICNISRGVVISKDDIRDNPGKYPVFSSQTENGGCLGRIGTYAYDGKYITWTTDGANAGTVFYREGKFSITNVCGLLKIKANNVDIKYLYYILSIEAPKFVNSGMGNPKLMSNVMARIQIPLPPLAVQREIVRILDKFTLYSQELAAELAARKKQYEFYRDKLLSFDNLTNGGGYNLSNLVRIVKLGEIGRVCMCKRILKSQTSSIGDVPFYKIGTFGGEADAYISQQLYEEYKAKYSYPKIGDVLISAAGTIGRTVIFDGAPAYFQDSNIVWIDNDEKVVLNKYLFYCYQLKPWQVSSGGTISRLYNENISRTEIPVPPLEVQERIVKVLDNFDAICSDLGIGLPAEIEARQKQYEYYRNKLLQFEIRN